MDSPWDYGSYDSPEDVVSGENGSYTASASSAVLVRIDIPKGAGFHAPCPPGVDDLGLAGATMDIHVVSDTVLSSTGTPASMPTAALKLRGKVTARTSMGVEPVGGVQMRLTPDVDDVPRSSTLSDATGKFLLCPNGPAVGRGDTFWLRADKDGYRPASRLISIGEAESVSLELVRD